MTATENGSGILLGIDIGGTFTDVVVYDPDTGQLHMAKAPSNPEQPAAAFFAGIDKVFAEQELGERAIARILHGSTVATNAVLEGSGSRLGLITTEGFGHILEIGRAYIPGIFTNYMRWEKPERLVPLQSVVEIPERLAVDGSVVREMKDEVATARIAALISSGVDAIAVSLLHSYINPDHERRIARIIHEIAPEMPVSLSSDILPEYREYERTMTTVLNSFVMPAVSRYLGEIGDGLDSRGVTADLHIVRSDAGVMSLAAARERPVNTVLSGPAGGVQAAAHLANVAGFPNIVSIDMGGTSTDVCLSTSAEPRLSTDTWVSHYPIKVPIIDITTIGAGGGSIAYVSSAGALRVGPRSAGAAPGPACYGRGGTAPTVTDANLVLGRLPVELAGGEISLDVERSREAIERDIAAPLGLSIPEAAYGILRIVNENMLGALRVVSVQRGIDPRELALVPFGGAGPVHGPELARLAGISTVVVPSTPGVLSALGFLLADIKQTFSLTHIGVLGALDESAYNSELEGLVQQADEWLDREGVAPEDRAVDVALDLRYAGQAYEIPISVSRRMGSDDWSKAAEQFHAEHQRRYGFDQPFARVEVVTLRVTATGRLPRPAFAEQRAAGSDPSEAISGASEVYFEDGFVETPVYDRQRLSPGNRIEGPAIITQPDCTTVLASDQLLEIDHFGNLVIQATQ